MELKFYPQYNNSIQTFKSNENEYYDKDGKIEILIIMDIGVRGDIYKGGK